MSVLFLGEGDLAGPARYLAAVLTWAKIPFDHRPDQAKIPKVWRKKRYGAVILSDYRYSSWTPCAREWLMEEVLHRGTGLLMIGGWASFTGLVGRYAGTSIERLLPVTCVRGDDRVNCSGGAVIEYDKNVGADLVSARHLDWNHPPVICGYHHAVPKPGSQILLTVREIQYRHRRAGTRPAPTLGKSHPLLVRGHAGRARTAAFLTDCAPHWAGGLVDWGKRRVSVKVDHQNGVEVGDQYLKMLRGVIEWIDVKRGTS